MRQRHRNWYQRMLSDAAAGWVSEQQPGWIARIDREQPNLRDALEGCLADDTEEAAEAGLRLATGLYEFWNFRGLYGEGRSWLSRVLARPGADEPHTRVEALCAASKMAAVHSEFRQATALLEEAKALAGPEPATMVRAQFAYTEGLLALARGDAESASSCFECVVELTDSVPTVHLRITALTLLAWAHEVLGDTARASEYCRDILAVTEPRGELLHRGGALRGLGVAAWRRGERDRAERYLAEALRVNGGLSNQLLTVFCLEAMAWTADIPAGAERAAVLMGAAQGLWPTGTSVTTVFHNLARFHEECERTARESLGDRRFDAARRQGEAMDMDTAVAYALGEAADRAARPGAVAKLTKRERQVAELVARGLSNKQIAAKLVISQRTAQGHVENILSKLGFTSRTQIAAWIVENAER
jgi:non-specific serine/threonine protein kinase